MSDLPTRGLPASGGLNLAHGERVILAKPDGSLLARMIVGAGWQPAAGRGDVDLDVSVIAFDAGGEEKAIVWHQHPSEFYGALQHTGDSKTGTGQGDAEEIMIDLGRLPDHIVALVFTINSFSGQTFTDITQAYFRMGDQATGEELVRFDLSETQPSTAVLLTIVRRTGQGSWDLRAIGEFHDARSVKKLVDPAARQVHL
jgi:stress response protein SCP2